MAATNIFDPGTLTGFHTWLSIIAILAGVPVVAGLIAGRATPLATGIFLVTAILTSVTGYFFPFTGLKPSHIVGAIALVVLAVALVALRRLARAGSDQIEPIGSANPSLSSRSGGPGAPARGGGFWGRIYAASMVASLFFLVFVAVAQAFAKVPALHALAPTQQEPPFAIAEGVALLVFVVLAILAMRTHGRPATVGA